MIKSKTKTAKAFAVLIIFIFLAAGCLYFTQRGFAYAAVDEPKDVVHISTAGDLRALSYYINKIGTGNDKTYYQLSSDLDLTDYLSESGDGYAEWGGEGFMPIGYKGEGKEMPFAGVFDGNGHTIKGLWINRPNNECETGLFGYSTGTVKNLNIETYNTKGGIIGNNYVGVVVGINDGLIQNCTASGQVSGNISVGGITGENNGKLTGCESLADISGESLLGGIAGKNASLIERSKNSGQVSGGQGSDSIGGIVGASFTSLESDVIPTISECANFASITGETWIGGISGYAQSANIVDCLNANLVEGEDIIGGIVGHFGNATLKNCLNVGTVTGEAEVGGIVGKIRGTNITNCYFDVKKTTISEDTDEDEPKGIGLTANELITREFLKKLNSSGEVWQLYAPDDFHYYPTLKAIPDTRQALSLQTDILAYKGAPVLSKSTLTYGETLSEITFAPDEKGTFVWAQPNAILSAGIKTAFAEFIPSSIKYGTLYDIEIQLEIAKAQSIISLSIKGWTAGKTDNAPQVEILAGEREKTDLIIEYGKRGEPSSKYSTPTPKKAGKYTVRATYSESDNYLASYYEYDFEIKPDLTWVIILASLLGGLALTALTIYFTDRKFRYLAKIKKAFMPKEVVREVIVEKPVYIQAQLNTEILSEHFEQLTPREMEVAKKILEGKTRKIIAEELGITERTAKSHIENILQKTACQNQRMFVLRFKI